MTTDEARELAEQWARAWNSRDIGQVPANLHFNVAGQVVAADVFHGVPC